MAPGCYDPFTARIISSLGFEAVALGGFATGASRGVMEPMMSMTEQVEHARRIAQAIDVPLIVDAGAGWGGPVHTSRTVRAFEHAGVSAISLEDQYYPKSMRYHQLPLPDEEVIPEADMRAKIEAAIEARQDSDFVIIARTDAVHGAQGGIETAIERANLYLEVGADLIKAFPDNMVDLERFAREVDGPTMSVYSEGTGRPRPNVIDLRRFGYRLVNYPSTVIMAVYRATQEMLMRRDAPDFFGEGEAAQLYTEVKLLVESDGSQS